jgi:quinol monooxygenase YgiN
LVPQGQLTFVYEGRLVTPAGLALFEANMRSQTPGVMVSSTYYDLKLIRTELAKFIVDELGYRGLFSELDSFPTEPDLRTIENCKRRVQEDADILILIVGGRYGFVVEETGKSVTNHEYEIARTKGIPIYVFIHKNSLVIMEIWKKTPSADFSAHVDNPKIFEFINHVRAGEGVWTWEFEVANDIIKCLRVQLAYLFGNSLDLFRRARDPQIAGEISGLSGKALALAIDRPRAWRFRLLAQLLIDEISARRDERRAFDLGIAWGQPEILPTASVDFGQWICQRMDDVNQDLDNVGRLFKDEIVRIEDIAEPADLGDTIFFAKQIGLFYQGALEWAARIRRCRARAERKPILDALSLWVRAILSELESLGPRCAERAEEALIRLARGEPTHITIEINMRVEDKDRLLQAFYLWKNSGAK